MSSATAPKKRKSDATSTSQAKKAKSTAAAHAQTVENILSDASNFALPAGPNATRDIMLQLAEYARSLENEVDSLKPKEKSKAELDAAAAKLASVVRSGITKQMGWKPSCKTGSAKWAYDGVCNDPLVFATLMGLQGPPTFKTKKFPKDDFVALMGGSLHASVRYATLYLMSDVNVQWRPEDGTFKLSGSYGKH